MPRHMSNNIPDHYADAPWNQPQPDRSPKLRRASNNFKHGLYSKDLAYNTPSEQDLYVNILHDFLEEYRPVGPTECGLVQQLASLQFRFQKVQSLYAEAMREEVLRQCKNAYADPSGSDPTERTIEARAFVALAKEPAFNLFSRELDRLPTRIQRVIRRLYEAIKLRHEAIDWPDLPTSDIPNQETAAPQEPLPMQKSETTAKTEDSKPDPMAPWKPKPILTKADFWAVWPGLKPFTKELVMDTSDRSDYRRRAFFEWTKLDEDNFWLWLHEGPDPIESEEPLAA